MHRRSHDVSRGWPLRPSACVGDLLDGVSRACILRQRVAVQIDRAVVVDTHISRIVPAGASC